MSVTMTAVTMPMSAVAISVAPRTIITGTVPVAGTAVAATATDDWKIDGRQRQGQIHSWERERQFKRGQR